MSKVVLLSEKDNVVTFLNPGQKGSMIFIKCLNKNIQMELKEDIPFGHKMAIQDIDKGENILKYGEVIGRATVRIPQGYHAHVHNIESLRVRYDLVKGDHS